MTHQVKMRSAPGTHRTLPGNTPKAVSVQQGFSLIEMLIAMAVGLMLIGGMITVFAGTKRSAQLNSTMALVQEHGRFALNSIVTDVRMAGFQGCVDSKVKATIRATGAPTTDYALSNITSSLVKADGTWLPEAPRNFTPPTGVGAPLPGTHALSVQFGSPETRAISPMTTVADDVVIAGSLPPIVTTGDLALISNCQVADIFKVTQAASGVLQHSAIGNSGDNRLSAPYGQTPNERAQVMRFEANIFYVGNTQRTNSAGEPVYALYRQSWPYDRPPVEMVEGVSHLKVRLGFRDSMVNGNLEYVSPEDSGTTDGRIESVQVGLLMQSFEQVASDTDSRVYTIAGTAINPGTTGSSTVTHYVADRRLRMAFSSTVSIRNRR
ncbi:MAG: prepilin-type N-terminal cleavage/methylation domain-containing protein [Granulosicoccus sp.]|nr:prepilin-type N-terminal cleavage/methylation domain-containing protein [Granulosicoccus sp.]